MVEAFELSLEQQERADGGGAGEALVASPLGLLGGAAHDGEMPWAQDGQQQPKLQEAAEELSAGADDDDDAFEKQVAELEGVSSSGDDVADVGAGGSGRGGDALFEQQVEELEQLLAVLDDDDDDVSSGQAGASTVDDAIAALEADDVGADGPALPGMSAAMAALERERQRSRRIQVKGAV